MSVPIQPTAPVNGHLVLIASYPRSGNTWLRLLFESLARGNGTTSINELGAGVYGYARRRLFDSLAPANAADLLPDEIDALLPGVFHHFDAQQEKITFVKVHDCARRSREGEWLFPPESVNSVLYLVRHPFDVAVSYAEHLNLPLSRIVESMGDNGEIVSRPGPRLPLPLHQQLGSWSMNAASWTENNPYSAHHIRFEDLQANPVAVFRGAAAAAGFSVGQDDVARAVDATRFERLKSEELQRGFRERPATSRAFFRSGRAGSWQGLLDERLREKLLGDHVTVMRKFGYRPDGGADPLS